MSEKLYDLLQTEFTELRAEYEVLASDGLTVREFFKLLASFLGRANRVVKHFGDEHGTVEERRECVVVAGQEFFEKIIEPLDLPWIPNWMESLVIDPAIGRSIRPVIEGLVDGLDEYLT